MQRLVSVDTIEDIVPGYRDTAIGRLLAYHDLGASFDSYERAELLVAMCMDHRVRLRIPENFAYVLRTGAGNLRDSEFKVSFAIAIGGIRAIAVIGHSDCGMVKVAERREAFVDGLVEGAGWEAGRAEEHFDRFASTFEIGDPIDFTLAQVKRLRSLYPDVLVAPLHYRVEDGRLYAIRE